MPVQLGAVLIGPGAAGGEQLGREVAGGDARPGERGRDGGVAGAGGHVHHPHAGFEVAVTLTGSLRSMVRIWRGDAGWQEAIRAGQLELHGAAALRRAVPSWFSLPGHASVPRPMLAAAG